jgi:peptide/nickel transport system substrate-binding protein
MDNIVRPIFDAGFSPSIANGMQGPGMPTLPRFASRVSGAFWEERMRKLLRAWSGAALALALVTGSGGATAQENCLRVMTFDWSATLIIDPAQIVNNSDLLHVNAAYEPLVVFDNDFQVKPWLAESFAPSTDGTEWTFILHKGVKFHDGSDLTSADVVYTYKRLLDPATASPAASELSIVDAANIRADGPDKVVFKTAKPVAQLPLLLATKYALVVKDGSTLDGLKKASNGTGPYLISNFQADAPRSILQKNPNYWQAGKPLAPCLELSGVADPVTRATAIQSGSADILIAADATTLPLLKADSNIELLEAKGALLMSMVMMVDKPPFDNPKVREALKLAVDRPAMVQLVTLGFGVSGNDNTVPPTSPLTVRTEPNPQNIEKAKALLAEAGYANGLTIDLWTGATDLVPGMLAMVQAYKEMAAMAGITVNVQTAPSNSFWDDVYLKQPFVTSYWYTRHPVSSMSLAFRKDAKYNETHWYREDFDALLDEAATTVDTAKSADLYKKAQEIIMTEGGQIVPVFASLVAAVRKNCSGYMPHIESRVMFQDIACK